MSRIKKTPHSLISDNPNLPYVVVNPYTDEDWLYERRFGVGASKCGITVGCHQYKNDTLYHLWRSILGLDKPIPVTWPMTKGHILEDYVARLFEEEIGYKICTQVQGAKNGKNWIAYDRKNPFLRVSPDRLFWTGKSRKLTDRGVLEIKSSSKMYQPEDLMDPSKCLMWYCQVQYNLHVLKLPYGYLGFIHDDGVCGGEHWFLKIPYNESYCVMTLIPAITSFWKLNLYPCRDLLELNKIDDATMIPPTLLFQLHEYAPAVSSSDDVSTRYPSAEEGKSIDGTDMIGLFDRWKSLNEHKKSIIEEMDEIETRVKVEMKDAEVVEVDGKVVATYKQNKSSKKFNYKALQEVDADTYNKYLIDTPGARVFKVR